MYDEDIKQQWPWNRSDELAPVYSRVARTLPGFRRCIFRAVLVVSAIALFCKHARGESNADAIAAITIDCSRELETSLPLGRYFNNSLRKAPPLALAPLVEKQLGRPGITRCWLTLDDMWDYRTDEYRFNFQIGKDYYIGDNVKNTYRGKNPMAMELESDVLFEDYLTSFSKASDELALNVRRYETEVLKGILTIEKWKEVLKNALLHYKKLCPNLVYIEMLNESISPHFGGVPDHKYYMFYKAGYQAINGVNATLEPELPLKIGGPANHFPRNVDGMLSAYVADTDPGKRLDFISYHEYGAGKNPATFASIQTKVQALLKKHRLDEDLPQFVTEMGYYGRTSAKWKDNLRQACFVTSSLVYSRHSEHLYVFPWVLYHTHKQTSHVMYTDDLRLTPFGFAIQMLQSHTGTEVYSKSTNLDKNGNGVGVLASVGEETLVFQLWNYSSKPFSEAVQIQNLPAWLANKSVRISQALINPASNNAFVNTKDGKKLRFTVSEATTTHELVISVSMKPMSLQIFKLSATGQ